MRFPFLWFMTTFVVMTGFSSLATAGERSIQLAYDFKMASGEAITRETGAFMNRKTNDSLWIGKSVDGASAWYLLKDGESVVARVSPEFKEDEDALNFLVRATSTTATDRGLKVPLFIKDCSKYRRLCESFDVNDTVSNAILNPRRLWAWLFIPVTLPLSLAADLVWDGMKDVWILADTALHTRGRVGEYRVLWSIHAWGERLLTRPGFGRKIAKKHFEMVLEILKTKSNDRTQGGVTGDVVTALHPDS